MRPKRPARVLIVEKVDMLAGMLAERLRDRGHDVTVVNGASRLPDAKFDVAMFDLDHAHGEDVEVAEDLAARGFITAAVCYGTSVPSELRERARALGVFVDKSSGVNAVVEAAELAGRVLRASIPPGKLAPD